MKDGFDSRARRVVSPHDRRHYRPRATSRARPASWSGQRTPPRWRTPSCACSSITATAPTATRRGSNTSSTAWAWKKCSRWSRRNSAASSTASHTMRSCRVRLSIAPLISACIRQKQPDRNWIGVVLPVGKMTADQMRGLAEVARDLGDGDIRLTVWQNLIISGVPSDKIAAAQAKIETLGLSTSANSDTRRARRLYRQCRLQVCGLRHQAACRGDRALVRKPGRARRPVNIHLTGCHHSCAQHYIGDIGLLACKMQTSEDGDTVEGYHIHVGGGFGPDAAIAPEIYHDVKAEDAPRTVERILKAYLAHRASPQESFLAFTRGTRSMRCDPSLPARRSNEPAAAARCRRSSRRARRSPRSSASGSTACSPGCFRSNTASLRCRWSRRRRCCRAGSISRRRPPWPAEDDDGAPWHDPAMPLADRMKLAEGRPLRRRMMAAMGQQDCGQCGYNCQDYSDAIVLKKEERLNLCVPGGKETTRMLKALHQELGEAPATPVTAKSQPRPQRLPMLRLHRPPRRNVRARARPRRAFCRARASTSRARRRRLGTLSSTWRRPASIMRSATPSACFRPTIPRSPTP